MDDPCDGAFDDAPEGEVLAAIDEHPRLDGLVEEVCAKAYEQDHDNTVDSAGDNSASAAAVGIGDDGCTAILEEACDNQRNDNGRESDRKSVV